MSGVSVCLSVYVCLCLSDCLSPICLYFCVSVRPCPYARVRRSVSVCPFPYVHVHVCGFAPPCPYVLVHCPYVRVSVSVCPCPCPYVRARVRPSVSVCPCVGVSASDGGHASRPAATAAVAEGCSRLELRCGDGSCVDLRRQCDGIRDCSDGADERDCGE